MKLFTQEAQSVPSNLLHDRYGWPPFSVLNTIKPQWQKRVDEWQTIIGDSTAGRDTKRYNATPTNTFSTRESSTKKPESVSTFDPYLCELMYRWFSITDGSILDPFSGGAVRGEVAAILGRKYFGIDISETQIYYNLLHYNNMQKSYANVSGSADWKLGDSDIVLDTLQANSFDMVFMCPPYYNLERYTKNPADLSRLPTYQDFLNKYTSILNKCGKCLKEDSFFVVVVSEIRKDPQSMADSEYLGLVPDTIIALRDICGLKYYNEIILENNIGSLPIRAPKYFDQSRKIGRHHQNILVFYKGDITHIQDKFGQLGSAE